MEETNEGTKRSRAGLSALRRHRKNMMPWSYVLFAAIFIALVVIVLPLVSLAPFWVGIPAILILLAIYRVWDKKTDKTNNTWGEGARGEARVGAELERLYEEGFHIFHDWDKGKGNVDHFIVGPQGVFAIETKAWTGEITSHNGRLKRNGKYVPDNSPVRQAIANAMAVRDLIGETHRKKPFVVPVLCFSKATVSCYGPVGGVEVANLGSINRVVVHGRRVRYSTEEVEEISRRIEEHLDTSPATRPGLPPEEPTRAKRLLHWFFDLPESTVFLGILGIAFLVSLVFPAGSSKVFLAIAYLYHLLVGVWASLF